MRTQYASLFKPQVLTLQTTTPDKLKRKMVKAKIDYTEYQTENYSEYERIQVKKHSTYS